MKITQLAAEPQLLKVTLDDETIIEQYGEAIEFWIYDRQPMDKYLSLAQGGENIAGVMEAVQEMILDEEGNPVIKDGLTLPSAVAFKAFTKIMEHLGK